MEQPHIGMEDIINYQKEQSRNLLLNALCRFWCHRSSLYHLVNVEHCTQKLSSCTKILTMSSLT